MNEHSVPILPSSELENIVTTAFLKEMSSHEYNEEYTPERRLEVVYAHFKMIQLIQYESKTKANSSSDKHENALSLK